MKKKKEMSKVCREEWSQDQNRAHINWQIFRIMAEFVDGFDFLYELKNEITIFGSARTEQGSRYYQDAEKLASMLGKAGYTVITGGGPGIMEAANKGAYDVQAPSIGLNIQLPYEQRINDYVTKGIGFSFFFSRKVMLCTSAQAYVYFTGGFGTLDELFNVLTLIQTQKMNPVPVILYGADYWQPLLDWIDKTVLGENKAISKKDQKIYTLVDTPKKAFNIIKKTKDTEYFNQFV